MKTLWIFDFDGTLVDSEKAIKKCYQHVTEKIAPERLNFIEKMVIGPTLDESTKMILTNKYIHLADQFKKKFQELYDDKFIYETQPYEHVDETLNILFSKGDSICIATNKRSKPTHKLINYLGWNSIFEWILCIDEYQHIQHKKDLLKLKEKTINSFERKFFIGDTMNDFIAARENNIPFIYAEYGYEKIDDIKIFNSNKISKIDELTIF